MKRLLVSFSGGRTSGYMTWRILQEWRDRYDDIVVLFANTGCEHEKTLEFVHNCDRHFGFNTVWLEAVVNKKMGEGTRHKVVTFETASREGEPYEEAIKKFGIPSHGYPWCTRDLKLNPLRSYVRSIGWGAGTYDQAIGIRVDEIDRMSDGAEGQRLLYPLVGWGVTKTMVLDWWASQDFDLDIPEHHGNCVFCFKKSDRKLFTIAKENPEFLEFPARMESLYSMCGTPAKRHGPQVFFRKYRSTQDIIASSKEPFTPWRPSDQINQMGLFSLDELDISNGCSESCEVEYI